MKLYLIPGLATDKRIWQKLELDKDIESVFLDYEEPESEDESFGHYADRILQRINVNEPFALAGMSMGGLLTSEVCKLYQPAKVIYISTIIRTEERPFYLNFFDGKPYIWKPVIANLKSFHDVLSFGLGMLSKENSDLITNMLMQASSEYLVWAVKNILSWKNEEVPQKYLRLHGSKDVVFPSSNISTHISISKGTHAMVLDKHQEISTLINDYMSQS